MLFNVSWVYVVTWCVCDPKRYSNGYEFSSIVVYSLALHADDGLQHNIDLEFALPLLGLLLPHLSLLLLLGQLPLEHLNLLARCVLLLRSGVDLLRLVLFKSSTNALAHCFERLCY